MTLQGRNNFLVAYHIAVYYETDTLLCNNNVWWLCEFSQVVHSSCCNKVKEISHWKWCSLLLHHFHLQQVIFKGIVHLNMKIQILNVHVVANQFESSLCELTTRISFFSPYTVIQVNDYSEKIQYTISLQQSIGIGP